MATFTFNVGKGRVNELARRVNSNDPANSALVIVALRTTATHATLKDLDTLAAVLGDPNTDEITNSGYSRIALTDASSITVTVDDTADDQYTDFPDVRLGRIAAGDDIDMALLCYDADTTSGTDTDVISLCGYDAAITPNGADLTLTVNAEGAFVAGE